MGRYFCNMLGGSILRYHTPQLGSGLAEELIKIAGPTVVGALERGVTGVQRGQKAKDVFGREAGRVVGQLKRKAPAMAARLLGNKRRRLPDIFA